MLKRPSKEKLIEIVKKILQSRLKVDTQEKLCRLALKILKKEDREFTVSPLRVKRIALEIPEIEVKAKTKKTPRLQKIDSCPVCDSKIKPIKVKNLLNKLIVIGYHCTDCGYESDLEAFMPMKYIFILKQRYK